MYTMRFISTVITSAPEFTGNLRLYISSREHESIYAVSDQGLSQASFSEDVLYVVDWFMLQNPLSQQLPRNILCVNAASLNRPDIPPDHNIILVDTAISAADLRALLLGSEIPEQQASYAPQLLDALYSGSLEQLCQTASTLCGNPIVFLGFNYCTTACCLLGSENPDIVQICNGEGSMPKLVTFLHDKRNQPLINSGAVLQVPGSTTRFLYAPIIQAGVHISSILLFEDRVSISESDRQLLSHVAKCFRLLSPMLDFTSSTRLVYEYVLIHLLSDDYVGDPHATTTRFSTLGYHIRSHLYVIVLDSVVQISAETLRQRLKTLASHARQIVGDNGLCTPFRDHIVILLNLSSPTPLSRILSDFRLFCDKNDLRAGLSPCFSDIAELKHHYRYALDAIGIGSLMQKGTNLYAFEELRLYKFISSCARSFSPIDLIPHYLTKLIQYDHENNSDLVETLYYYIYTVKNTKTAAEMMHIHRNTLLYRLEKIRSLIGVDLEDGDIFLHLMLAFKFLEFDALRNGRELCFTPITRKPEIIDP